ncbi:MAG: hypothetical protein ACK56F_20955, partial [bacterium]
MRRTWNTAPASVFVAGLHCGGHHDWCRAVGPLHELDRLNHLRTFRIHGDVPQLPSLQVEGKLRTRHIHSPDVIG